MTPLHLFEEPIGPTGGVIGSGAANPLGKPALNQLALLLREAVQNSWDARCPSQSVSVSINYFQTNASHRAALSKIAFASQPPSSSIRQSLARKDLSCLIIRDTGTIGLNGPLKSNDPSRKGEKRNFDDFFWKIGRRAVKTPEGGTYGYGKTAFYLLSRARTICAYSRCDFEGCYQTRLMAANLSDDDEKRMKTGRSWWGQKTDYGVGPLLDKAADELALSLGFEPFEKNQTGTAIMVLDPALEEVLLQDQEEPATKLAPEFRKQAAEYLAASIVFWFWPKMIRFEGKTADIFFKLMLDGEEVPIPDPESLPPFDLFAQALRQYQEGEAPTGNINGPSVQRIMCQRPAKTLGFLSLLKNVRRDRPDLSGLDLFEDPVSQGILTQCHHVALMRNPRLIVKYLPAETLPTEHLEYAGVFVTNDEDYEVESAFTQSEPPAHDDWVPEDLSDRNARTFVRMALRRIREAADSFAAPPATENEQSAVQPLADFSRELGGLLAGVLEGPGAENPNPSGEQGKTKGKGSSGGRAKVSLEGPAQLQAKGSDRELLVPFRVTPAPGEAGVKIAVRTFAVAEGRAESEAPLNTAVPKVLRFEKLAGQTWQAVSTQGPSLTLDAAACKHLWRVSVSVPPDTRVEVDVAART